MMKATQETLKLEIKHRLLLLEDSMQELKNDKMVYLLFCNEHSKYLEFLNLIELFENRLGFEKFEISKHTPIFDYKTKEPLKIGDKVENLNKECGFLNFDDCFNKYVIKTETGGQITSRYFVKIKDLYDYKIDSIKVECRPNPHKKKW